MSSEAASEVASTRSDSGRYRSELDDKNSDRPPWILTYAEFKLLIIVGVGKFLDSYDLFIINPVTTMLQYRLYGGGALPPALEGFVKSGANIGNVIGQFGFGYAGDAFGRKAVYGQELMVMILGTILCICAPTNTLSPSGVLIYIAIFRIVVGAGVGGDYPLSASVLVDRASLRKRATLLAYAGTNQGWGNFMGGLITIIVLACYKHTMDVEGKTSKVDGVWRIIVGISLIPAFANLYQRLTLPESTRFIASQRLGEAEDALPVLRNTSSIEKDHRIDEKDGEPESKSVSIEERASATSDSGSKGGDGSNNGGSAVATKATFSEFMRYFSEWRHAKLLIGTCMCWFLLDIAFYGINLNQNFVLEEIGFDGKTGTPWEKLFKISTGGMIITTLGFLPGYYMTVFMVEKLGRKWIQIQGFLMAALFLGILAGKFTTLSKASFIVCFTFLQFFFNFGANMTIAMIPAELFPTRYRSFANGVSASAGKTGAIISSVAFNQLSEEIGTPAILWIFFGCCIVGAGFTLLLPEVRGRDPDLIFAEELREAREKAPERRL